MSSQAHSTKFLMGNRVSVLILSLFSSFFHLIPKFPSGSPRTAVHVIMKSNLDWLPRDQEAHAECPVL